MDMYTIDELRAIIKEELDKKEYIQEPYSLFEPILYILEDGGKRLRPLLTLMAYNLYREDIEKVLKSAIGIEITRFCMMMSWMTRSCGEVGRLFIKSGIATWQS